MDATMLKQLASMEDDLTAFAQSIVQIKSYTENEEDLALFIKNKMIQLEYDEVFIDKLGNVIGIIGDGPLEIMFDSHIDTVMVNDEADWTYGPFSGEIVDGKLYGRGAVDMKGAVAATVYAGHALKKLGLTKGKKIYISTSVMEEDYDGEPLAYLCAENNITPDYAIICEPSSLDLALGHRGRALIKVTMDGVSAHGSAPEKGVNAIYKMNQLISRVENLGQEMLSIVGEKGSLALTKIESDAVSINAIPPVCNIYLDRRLVMGEDYNFISQEMDQLLAGTEATWQIYDEVGTSWRGENLVLHSFLPAWETDINHTLSRSCISAYKELHKAEPKTFKWDFSTNGVATARLGIPTIGIGPGDAKLAHTIDEHCPVDEITKAFKIYVNLVKHL